MKSHLLTALLLLAPALPATPANPDTAALEPDAMAAPCDANLTATCAQAATPETGSPEARPDTRPAVSTASPPVTRSWLGQDFIKVRSQPPGPEGSACDEYVPVGENAGDWSQLVAVQRLPGSRPGDLLAALRGKPGMVLSPAEHTDKGQLCHVRVGEGVDEHVGVMFATADRNAVGMLILICYLTKPARMDATKLNLQLEAWRNSLLRHGSGNITRRTK